MNNQKIAAIVPALNEEKNIARVLKILLKSKKLNEIIVVDDGSIDKTAQIAKKMGAKVINLTETKGKGEAMQQGVKSTDAEIILFFDADLISLSLEHISLLLKPILKNETVMTIGLREDRWLKLRKILVKIDPLLIISGQRAIRRFVFEKLSKKFIQGYMVEIALNYCCQEKKLPVKYVKLKGLDIVIKEKKWGLIKGFINRLKMFYQLFKIRILIWKDVQKNHS
jgi:glycosyltransferase involved in cell wall biosynthesis